MDKAIQPSLAAQLASRIGALKNCVRTGNKEWEQKHMQVIAELTDYLPSGSGIDNGCVIDFNRSTGNKLVILTSFHHMNDNGYYDGWTEHTITVKPAFIGLEITVSGRDRNEIKEYLHDTFYYALESNNYQFK